MHLKHKLYIHHFLIYQKYVDLNQYHELNMNESKFLNSKNHLSKTTLREYIKNFKFCNVWKGLPT